MARLPIRVRVTLAFAAVMAVLLAATGGFLYLRLGSELDATMERGLRSRATDLTALVHQADSGLAEAGRSPLTEQGENLAQILDRSGTVLDAPPSLRTSRLLTDADVAAARQRTIVVDRADMDGDPARLLATPVNTENGPAIVVVGESLDDRAEALSTLAGQLLLGFPVALLLASMAGYGVAAGALRPVEEMRRRAAAIQAAAPGQRLPVPASRDEVARLGETLNGMLARLEEALARERTFVGDASHELRTPLAVLKTELELALGGKRSLPEMEAALSSAAEQTDRLAQLAEDLLVIARSDQGRLPIRPTDVNLERLLHDTRERFSRRAAQRGASVEFDVPAAVRLHADPLRLEQALGNLIDNALRHGGTRITIGAREVDHSVELHVLDDGSGFPADFLPRAFERFTRADTARGRGGTGLGLAIVAVIAESHGGEARASNRPEGGADVYLQLPAAR
jgi:two-component system OmpR family sensor kinase